jgi:hypothetical protein
MDALKSMLEDGYAKESCSPARRDSRLCTDNDKGRSASDRRGVKVPQKEYEALRPSQLARLAALEPVSLF